MTRRSVWAPWAPVVFLPVVVLVWVASIAPWVAGAAWAQGTTTPMMTAMPGTCSGSIGGKNISGKVYLLVPTPPLGDKLVAPGDSSSGIFDLAECQCQTQDINLQIFMDPGGTVPLGAGTGVAMYIGPVDCSTVDSATRNNQCVQIAANVPPGFPGPSLDYTRFEASSPTAINIPLPAAAVTSPSPAQGQAMSTQFSCPNAIGGDSRTIAIVFGQVDMPSATCKISLPVRTIPPPVPTSVVTSTGNSRITVSWDVPAQGQGIERYQILCRDLATPNAGLKPELSSSPYFSSCVTDQNGVHHMHRRISIPASGLGITPGSDGGTATDDAGTGLSVPPGTVVSQSRQNGGRRTEEIPGRPSGNPVPLGTGDMAATADMATADMATADMATTDMAAADMAAADMSGPAPGCDLPDGAAADNGAFAQLDTMFICTDQIKASGQTLSASVEGLQNGHTYEFKVLAIDYYGNPSASASACGVPQPTQNLLEGLYDRGNHANGFGCSAGGAQAVGLAGMGLVPLGMLLGVYGRRRRRSRQRKQGR